MQSRFSKRLDALEQTRQGTQQQGQTVERFTADDGEECVRIGWNGQPSGKVMPAWMWDA